uniref:Uncharacterized protein n=1 Tax=Ditylum brightwellii TaxID=49249 RepID=A0A6U3UCD6_9STRA|mmetsp:Transcript_18654/g.26996  ORF Transcript_18654/g.26996 Transcript_18654/m.26996 type:complete len:376 (-) Transcript_18654:184-1311(-)
MDDDIDELTSFDKRAITLYEEKEAWKHETSLKSVEDWTVSELQTWIAASLRRANPQPKVATVVEKLLRVMDQEDMNGSLLIAGGKTYLSEVASFAISSKSEQCRLPHAVALIFDAVDEALKLQGSVPYWERLRRESQVSEALCDEFESKAAVTMGEEFAGIGTRLHLALEPHPLDRICTSLLNSVEMAEVIEADSRVCKRAASAGQCLFKVVSVAPYDEPDVVWCNLIYVRTDADHAGIVVDNKFSKDRRDCDVAAPDSPTMTTTGGSPCAMSKRKLRRRKKREGSVRRWELLASVDFAQHGSALPGHWHLNRNMCGDLLPHMSIRFDTEENGGGSSSNEVWHGREDCCPLWWHFIPEGMNYKKMPSRLRKYYDE